VNLRDLVTEVAAGLPGVEAKAAPRGSITWSSNGVAFAALRADGLTAEFRLDPAVAAAAMRTPEVIASERGPDWVTFAPAVLDDHGADRAAAWFASAYRRVSHG
jgi:hypothetical protein